MKVMTMQKLFEVGKAYKHTSGQMIHIIGSVQTTRFGFCLVAESSWSDDLKPVGIGLKHTVGWHEIPLNLWYTIFSGTEKEHVGKPIEDEDWRYEQ